MDGKKIRMLRKEKGLTINQFAIQTGFTASYISQIERNLIDPSLSALEKICELLNVSIHYFLENSEDKMIITREKDREKLILNKENRKLDFILPLSNNIKIKPSFGVFETTIKSKKWNTHDFDIYPSEECIIVKQGTLLAVFNDKSELLEEGDCIYIASNLPHKFYNPTDDDLQIICITSPSIY